MILHSLSYLGYLPSSKILHYIETYKYTSRLLVHRGLQSCQAPIHQLQLMYGNSNRSLPCIASTAFAKLNRQSLQVRKSVRSHLISRLCTILQFLSFPMPCLCRHEEKSCSKSCRSRTTTLKHRPCSTLRGHLLQTPDACVTLRHALLQVHVTDATPGCTTCVGCATLARPGKGMVRLMG